MLYVGLFLLIAYSGIVLLTANLLKEDKYKSVRSLMYIGAGAGIAFSILRVFGVEFIPLMLIGMFMMIMSAIINEKQRECFKLTPHIIRIIVCIGIAVLILLG